MRRLYLILIFAVSAILLLGYMYSSSYSNFFLDGHPPEEKIEVGRVSFDSANPNNFQINVKWLDTRPADSVIVFTDALFRNSTGDGVAWGSLPESELEPRTEMTLNISTDIDLPPGEYTITLVTERGGSFVSPPFTKP